MKLTCNILFNFFNLSGNYGNQSTALEMLSFFLLGGYQKLHSFLLTYTVNNTRKPYFFLVLFYFL